MIWKGFIFHTNGITIAKAETVSCDEKTWMVVHTKTELNFWKIL